MKLDTLLSTIILVTFLVTILMAIASYAAYKLRERRRPRAHPATASGEPVFFERILAESPATDVLRFAQDDDTQ
jgi:hypothetical protein